MPKFDMIKYLTQFLQIVHITEYVERLKLQPGWYWNFHYEVHNVRLTSGETAPRGYHGPYTSKWSAEESAKKHIDNQKGKQR